jgi:hypothetical protein
LGQEMMFLENHMLLFRLFSVFKYLAEKYLEQLNVVVEQLPPSQQKIGQGRQNIQYVII